MRRSLFALLVVMVLAPAGLLMAQAQDPLVASARRFSQQGNVDTAIALLRSGLTARPNDEALKQELIEMIGLKQNALRRQLADLERELMALRPPPPVPNTAGCGDANQFPVRVGGNVAPPQKIVDVKPVYPPEAQAARIQGIVIMEARIDCTGAVWDVRVLRGQPMLSEAALESVRQWRYDPALLDGKPVPVIMTVTVTFTLR